jgi:ribonuclease P protein subunit POP4
MKEVLIKVMITPENLLSHELVGLRATILCASQPTLVGLSGTIIFETKNMITIKVKSGSKRVSKLVARKIKLHLPGNVCFINGASLIGRPEDRVLRYP